MTDELRDEAERLWHEMIICPGSRRAFHEMYCSIVAIHKKAHNNALEKAAMLHQDINPASDEERRNGDPGAGAMGAVIEYRDKIRKLKVTP